MCSVSLDMVDFLWYCGQILVYVLSQNCSQLSSFAIFYNALCNINIYNYVANTLL